MFKTLMMFVRTDKHSSWKLTDDSGNFEKVTRVTFSLWEFATRVAI